MSVDREELRKWLDARMAKLGQAPISEKHVEGYALLKECQPAVLHLPSLAFGLRSAMLYSVIALDNMNDNPPPNVTLEDHQRIMGGAAIYCEMLGDVLADLADQIGKRGEEVIAPELEKLAREVFNGQPKPTLN